MLSFIDIKLADSRVKLVILPSQDFTPTNIFSRPFGLKSHDWKEVCVCCSKLVYTTSVAVFCDVTSEICMNFSTIYHKFTMFRCALIGSTPPRDLCFCGIIVESFSLITSQLFFQLVCKEFCLRGLLGARQRATLFDCLTLLCAESQDMNSLPNLQLRLNTALARMERDFQ